MVLSKGSRRAHSSLFEIHLNQEAVPSSSYRLRSRLRFARRSGQVDHALVKRDVLPWDQPQGCSLLESHELADVGWFGHGSM